MNAVPQDRGLVRFFGRHDYAVDAQRRFPLPKSWRDSEPARNEFILMPGPHRTLQLVPTDLFGELVQNLHRKVLFENDRDYLTYGSLGAFTDKVSCDRQGRIALSKDLMEMAEITDRVVLVGAIERVQIWEPNAWQRECMRPREWLHAFEQIAARTNESN